MGFINNKKWPFVRFHANSRVQWNTRNKSSPSQTSINFVRGRKTLGKGGYRKYSYAGNNGRFFLVAKKKGELCPVINLKPLNRYIVKKHFKMDTLAKVINLENKGLHNLS